MKKNYPKFKPTYQGLVLKFNQEFLNLNLKPTTKLVYAGLYFSVPPYIRLKNINEGYYHEFLKSKKELYRLLGVSKTQYYRAINELEEFGILETKQNASGTTRYILKMNMEYSYSEVVATINSEVLQRKYVSTKIKDKTFSANSKIILGILANKQQSSFKRKIKTTVTDLAEEFDIPRSTLYHLIQRFVSCSIADVTLKEKTIITLLLIDEYSMYQRELNRLKNTGPKKRQYRRQKISTEESDMLDSIWAQIK